MTAVEIAGPSLRSRLATPEWHERARCAETDPEAFFPEKGQSTREPIAICAQCEVRPECLEWALDTGQRFGVAGGMSERQRARLQTARRKAALGGAA